MRKLGQGTWVFIALLAGLATGIAMRSLQVSGDAPVVTLAATIGTLWVNAIRMTVIPLIIGLLVVGIAEPASTGATGRLGWRAFVFFYASLALVAAASALIAPPLFTLLTLDPASVAALRAGTSGADAVQAAAAMPGFRDWLLGVIPTNPIRAAADAALLPLIFFVLAFAYALRHVEQAGRTAVVAFFRGTADAMMVVVRWILLVAPLGVFALALVLGTRLGTDVVGALGFYVGVQVVLVAAAGLAMYPVAVVKGGVPLRAFARAVAPAQVVALSTRSSFAALPAGLDGARRILQVPADVAGFVMPLAVAIFRYTAPAQWIVGALFIAELYGIPFGPVQVLTIALASVLLNASVPGIPSGGLLVQAPAYAAVGLPVEGLAVLIAVDMLPDLFRTAGNVTSHLAAVVALNGRGGRSAEETPAPAPRGDPGRLAHV